jgi:hypothetical protein
MLIDPDYDLELLCDEVYLYDNAVDVARRDLPIPDPIDVFDDP